MDKQIALYSHKEILLSHEKEYMLDIWSQVDGRSYDIKEPRH